MNAAELKEVHARWHAEYGGRPEMAWSDPRYSLDAALDSDTPPLAPPDVQDYAAWLKSPAHPDYVPSTATVLVAESLFPVAVARGSNFPIEEELERRQAGGLVRERLTVVVGPRFWWWREYRGPEPEDVTIIRCRVVFMVQRWLDAPHDLSPPPTTFNG